MAETTKFEAILCYGEGHFDRFDATTKAGALQFTEGRRVPPLWWRVLEYKDDGTWEDVAHSESAADVLKHPEPSGKKGRGK